MEMRLLLAVKLYLTIKLLCLHFLQMDRYESRKNRLSERPMHLLICIFFWICRCIYRTRFTNNLQISPVRILMSSLITKFASQTKSLINISKMWILKNLVKLTEFILQGTTIHLQFVNFIVECMLGFFRNLACVGSWSHVTKSEKGLGTHSTIHTYTYSYLYIRRIEVT